MKKVFGAMMCAGSLFLVAGCDGGGGGAVTDDVEMSAVEEYEANLAASETDLDAAAPEDGDE